MKINIQIGTRSPPPLFKRVVVWLLLLAFIPVVFPAFAINARAEEIPNFMELLDYGYVHHDDHYVSGNRTEIIDNDEVVYFNLPYGMTVNYVDILFYASASVQKSVSAGLSAWGYTGLHIKQISDDIYRAYGYISEHTYEKIEFKFSSTSTSGYVNFYSVKVQFSTGVSQYVGGTVVRGDGFAFTWDGMSEEVWTSNPTYLDEASLQLIFRNWTAFDSITLYLDMRVEEITSIRLRTDDGTAIPFDHSVFANATEQGYYLLSISFDLNGVRDSGSPPILEITYKNMLDYDNYIHFYGCSGFVSLRYPNPELYWYQEIFKGLVGEDGIPFMQYINSGVEAMAGVVGNMYVYMTQEIGFLLDEIATRLFDLEYECSRGFTSVVSAVQTFYRDTKKQLDDIIDALSPDTTNSNEMMDDMASQATEMSDLNNQMESMQKPDVGSIDTDLSGLVSSGDVTLATTALTVVLSDGFMSSIFMMALLFMLASYVLFGKR